MALERSQCHQESHGLWGNREDGARAWGRCLLESAGPGEWGGRERIQLERDLRAETGLASSWEGTSAHNWILSQGKVCPSPISDQVQAYAGPLPKGFSPLGLADTGNGHSLYRTLHRPAPLLLWSVLALLNNHPPLKQLTITPRAGQGPGAGHTGRTEKESEKSPRESSCNLFFGDLKEVGCSCVPVCFLLGY